jgi:hypothetical protein
MGTYLLLNFLLLNRSWLRNLSFIYLLLNNTIVTSSPLTKLTWTFANIGLRYRYLILVLYRITWIYVIVISNRINVLSCINIALTAYWGYTEIVNICIYH